MGLVAVVFNLSSIKSFVAFCFFYFVGQQMYHHKNLLLNLKVRRYFYIIGIFFYNSIFHLAWLMKIDLSPYDPYNNFFKKKIKKSKKLLLSLICQSKLLNMVKASILQFMFLFGIGDSPSGLEMIDIGNGLWTVTTELSRGAHTYFSEMDFTVNGMKWLGKYSKNH